MKALTASLVKNDHGKTKGNKGNYIKNITGEDALCVKGGMCTIR